MKMTSGIPTKFGILIVCIFCISIFWEVLQTPLYRGTTLIYGTYTHASFLDPQYWVILAYAAVGDVLYISLMYACVALFRRDALWFTKPRRASNIFFLTLLGFALAMLIERRGLGSGGWGYSSLMPLVPLLDIGWSPFVQLAAVSLLSLYLMRRFLR